MQNWFECKVKFIKIDEDGRERRVTEKYLIDAVSFTDAEARMTEKMTEITRGEFSFVDIKQSNITEILSSYNGQFYYKGKISLVAIDEKAGREKRVNEYFIIEADNIDEALKYLNEGLSYILVPFSVDSIAVTTIADVFPYFETKDDGSSDQSE